MTRPVFTCSWDDGHPADLRLAEALAEAGCPGTFYVPLSNREGRPVMRPAEVRRLAGDGFEIGGHGLDHVRLTALPPDEAARQIADGRRRLEDLLGQAVEGFCYPGGRHDAGLRRLVAASGFRYARTTEMFRLDRGNDPLALPTTLQLYPHGSGACLRNWLRNGGGTARLRLARRFLAQGFDGVLDAAAAEGGVFHLWGHSWEIEERGLWPTLTALLASVTERIAAADRLTNRRIAGG